MRTVTYAEYKRRTQKTRRSVRGGPNKNPANPVVSLMPKAGQRPHMLPPPVEHRMAMRAKKNEYCRQWQAAKATQEAAK